MANQLWDQHQFPTLKAPEETAKLRPIIERSKAVLDLLFEAPVTEEEIDEDSTIGTLSNPVFGSQQK